MIRSASYQWAVLSLLVVGGCAPLQPSLAKSLEVSIDRMERRTDAWVGLPDEITEGLELRREGGCALFAARRERHPRQPSAGVVRVRFGAEEAVLERQGASYPDWQRRDTTAWKPGETIAFDGTGGDAAPFHLEVAAPPSFEIVEPQGEASLLEPLTVRWIPIPGERVGLKLTAFSNDSYVRCEFDGTKGAATVPQAVLADLATGPARLWLRVQSRQSVDAGAVRVIAIVGNSHIRRITLDLEERNRVEP